MRVVFIGGLSLGPSPSSEPAAVASRRLYLLCVIGVYLVLAIVGGILVFHLAKTDCYKPGVLCPKWGMTLYSRRRLVFGGAGTRETGICPHGHYQLVDEVSGKVGNP